MARGSRQPPVVVSACLAGRKCRWNSSAHPVCDLKVRTDGAKTLALCPELLAGLGVPRAPLRLRGGDGAAVLRGEARVIRGSGSAARDVTAAVLAGARRAAALARAAGSERAILKERSPSCGVRLVHGEQSALSGIGLFAALLQEMGLKLSTEEDDPSTL